MAFEHRLLESSEGDAEVALHGAIAGSGGRFAEVCIPEGIVESSPCVPVEYVEDIDPKEEIHLLSSERNPLGRGYVFALCCEVPHVTEKPRSVAESVVRCRGICSAVEFATLPVCPPSPMVPGWTHASHYIETWVQAIAQVAGRCFAREDPRLP